MEKADLKSPAAGVPAAQKIAREFLRAVFRERRRLFPEEDAADAAAEVLEEGMYYLPPLLQVVLGYDPALLSDYLREGGEPLLF